MALAKINYLYSVVYIALTGTDKYFYREHSIIHKLLVSFMH
jgi:hypothetical protein